MFILLSGKVINLRDMFESMLIDTHAHLDLHEFDQDRNQVIKTALEGGLSHIITVGIDYNSSKKAIELAHQNNSIYASVGYHPHNAGPSSLKYIDQVTQLAGDPNVVAWGEIGLDFYRDYSLPSDQLDFFKLQLKLANDLDLPVIIHDREAHAQVYDILKKHGKGKGVIHCFSGDKKLALAFIELGYYISIPGVVTYKNAILTKEVAASIPIESMLLETDAPFLAPVPKRGKRNEPFFISYTAREVARLRNIDLAGLARQTTDNAKTLFDL